MECVAGEVEGVECSVGNFDALGIFVLIRLGAHRKSGGSCGRRDQLNNRLEAPEGFSAPVDGNEGKESMFDFVPFARAGRQMANSDGDAQGIRQCLQFYFPQTNTVSIASPTVGSHQEARCFWITLLSHGQPPPAYCVDGEAGGIVIATNADPPLVIANIVDAIRDGASQFGVDKIMPSS